MVIRILKYMDKVQTPINDVLPGHGIGGLQNRDYGRSLKSGKSFLNIFRNKESTESWFGNGLGTACADVMHLKAPSELVQHVDIMF
jgi:hypothetical protein